MGILKNEHEVYVVRRKVPAALERAVATVLGNGKQRQAFLQKSLKTKDKAAAKRLAAPVFIEFDRIIAEARKLTEPRPHLPARNSLTQAEIAQIASYHLATRLSDDAALRREGWRFAGARTPSSGLAEEQFERAGISYTDALADAKASLARGNYTYVEPEVELLLADIFRIDLNRESPSYRSVLQAVLEAEVRALAAVLRRQAGEVVTTPNQPDTEPAVTDGNTLTAALEGWRKERQRSPRTLTEYERAIRLFIELNGDVPVIAIKRIDARRFREALMDVPRHRSGNLLEAPLPELVAWAREHPQAPRITAATINKLFGGVQAVVVWARNKGGIIPDDVPWSDPFSDMRLDENDPERDPFEIVELNRLFKSTVFTAEARPTGGKGDAAFWLPLLALFTGARRGELASLTLVDVARVDGTASLTFTEDAERGKRLKTRASRRVVPLQQRLIELGFLEYVEQQRAHRDATAWLFPLLSPDTEGGQKAWSKWFSRYIRGPEVGIADTNKVFHSFRHNFKDALRAGGVGEDVVDALAGHANATVGRRYGAKEMLRRFTMPILANAIGSAQFDGLDLSHIKRFSA